VTNPTEVLVTERQAATVLSVSVSTLRRWRREGRPPFARRIGPRALRYRLADLTDHVAGAAVNASKPR
jgi:predicted DNA-binding transcriptional regulator AlpA